MGNKESNEKINRQNLDIASLQVEELKECPEIYKVIGLKQGGELVQLMKMAQKSKDYSKVDEYISTKCSQYLYKDGAGEMVFKMINYSRKISCLRFREFRFRLRH